MTVVSDIPVLNDSVSCDPLTDSLFYSGLYEPLSDNLFEKCGKFDPYKWDCILDEKHQYTCIVAPRRSGKTTSLTERYLNTDNSIYLVSTINQQIHQRRFMWQGTQNNFEKQRNVMINADIVWRKYIQKDCDHIFVDELFNLGVQPCEMIQNFRQINEKGRITIVITPTNKVTLEDFSGYKVFNFNNYNPIKNIFDNEGDLFVI
jgi:hypothetical protein